MHRVLVLPERNAQDSGAMEALVLPGAERRGVHSDGDIKGALKDGLIFDRKWGKNRQKEQQK